MSGETLRFDRINRGPHRAGIPRDVFRRGGRDRFSIACGRAGSYLSTHSASITSLYARFSLGSRPSLEIFNRRLALGLTHLLLQNPSLTEDISLGTMRQSYFIGEARESAQEADRPALETTERFIANTQVTTRALDILSNTENLQSFITSLSLIIRQLSTETKAENQQAKSAGEQLTEFVNSINASIKQTAEKIEQNIRTKLKPGEKVEIKDHEEIITRLVEAGKLVKKIAEAIKSHEPLALAKELKAAESNLDPIAKEVIKAKIASEIAKDPKANLPKVIKAAATDKAIKSLLLKAIAENLKEAPARSTKTKTQEATSQPQLKPVPATTQGAKLKVGGKPAKAVGQKIFGQKITAASAKIAAQPTEIIQALGKVLAETAIQLKPVSRSPEVRQEALREIKTAAELTAKVVAQTESMPYVSQAKIAPAIQTLVGQVVELLDQPNIAQDAKPIVTELINTLVSLPVGKKAVLKAIEDKLFKPTKLALRPKDSLQQRRLLMDFSEDRAETKDDNLAKMVASFKDSEAVKKLLPLIVKTAPEAKAMMALISETSTSQLTINVVAVSNILRRATELIKTGRSADAAQLLRQLPNTLPELKVPHLEVLTTHLEAEGREVVIQFDRAAQKPITNKVTTQANSVEAKAMDPIMEITDHDVIQTLRIIHEVKTNAKVRAALEQAANVRAITAHDVQLACGHLLPKQVRTQEERGRKAILSIDRGDGTAIPISVISPTGSKGDGKSSDDSHPYKQPYERAPEIITFREDEAAASSF